MKLCEIVNLPQTDEQLDEVSFKQAVAGGAFALGALLGHHIDSKMDHVPKDATPTVQQAAPKEVSRADLDIATLTNTILKKYRGVSPELATQVATLAKKYEKDSFPRAEDILAISGIESSFRPHAVSQLKRDPAVGLMQVRPGVWGLDAAKLKSSMEMQVKTGAEILNKYYRLLGNAEDAVHAYNVGIGNFRKGKHNIKYVHKYKSERKMYRM